MDLYQPESYKHNLSIHLKDTKLQFNLLIDCRNFIPSVEY